MFLLVKQVLLLASNSVWILPFRENKKDKKKKRGKKIKKKDKKTSEIQEEYGQTET